MELTRQTVVTDYGQTLIPILKSGEVKSTYALRLTPMGKYTLDHIKLFLQQFNDYVCVKEESKKGKEHFHAVLFTDQIEDEVRDKIRAFLALYFTEPPKRGDANKQYNLSECEDLELSLVYILKDGGDLCFSKNIDHVYLESLRKQSYKKFSKVEFVKQLEELKKTFKQEDLTIETMMIKIVQLKAMYRQPINMTYIYQLSMSLRIHNQPDRSEQYVQNFLSRIL